MLVISSQLGDLFFYVYIFNDKDLINDCYLMWIFSWIDCIHGSEERSKPGQPLGLRPRHQGQRDSPRVDSTEKPNREQRIVFRGEVRRFEEVVFDLDGFSESVSVLQPFRLVAEDDHRVEEEGVVTRGPAAVLRVGSNVACKEKVSGLFHWQTARSETIALFYELEV